jgi:hypothetical protein
LALEVIIVMDKVLNPPVPTAGDFESDDSPSLASDARTVLERRWGNAAAEVIHAQREYATLVSQGAADDEAIGAAWLRVWRAQERQRELSSELDRLET